MLTVRDHMVLDVESKRWKYPGARDTNIQEHLGMTPVEHALRVRDLIDTPEANAEYPVLCARLRRINESRYAARTARRLERARPC